MTAAGVRTRRPPPLLLLLLLMLTVLSRVPSVAPAGTCEYPPVALVGHSADPPVSSLRVSMSRLVSSES